VEEGAAAHFCGLPCALYNGLARGGGVWFFCGAPEIWNVICPEVVAYIAGLRSGEIGRGMLRPTKDKRIPRFARNDKFERTTPDENARDAPAAVHRQECLGYLEAAD